MSLPKLRLLALSMLLLAALAACTAGGPMLVLPSPTPLPLPTETPLPPTVVPSPSPQPAAASAVPDPQEDPIAALLYSASAENFSSAGFTYEMFMNIAAATEADAEAMGNVPGQDGSMNIRGSGQGALEVVDADTGQANIRMGFEVDAMGQKAVTQIVKIGDTAWVRTDESGPWQEFEGDAAQGMVASVEPSDMLEAFRSATDVRWVDDEPLDGEPVHHLHFSVDPRQMELGRALMSAAAIGGASVEEDIDTVVETMSIEADVWLAEENLSLRQEKMNLSFVMPMAGRENVRLRLTASMTLRFTDVNEPVTIEPPADVAG